MRKTNIKLSPRAKMRLTESEKAQLSEYVKDFGSYATINLNTGIDSRTINETIKRGWLQLSSGVKLRDFLKDLKATTV